MRFIAMAKTRTHNSFALQTYICITKLVLALHTPKSNVHIYTYSTSRQSLVISNNIYSVRKENPIFNNFLYMIQNIEFNLC